MEKNSKKQHEIEIRNVISKILENYIKEEEQLQPQPQQRRLTDPANNVKTQETPGKFEIEILKSKKTSAEMWQYIKSTLGEPLNMGSGRIVFNMPDKNKVLKFASNPSGLAQNKEEIAGCAAAKSIKLFPVVFETSPDGQWMIVEKAQPMTPELFQKLTGLAWLEYTRGIAGALKDSEYLVSNNPGLDKEMLMKASKNQFFRRIVGIMKICKYDGGDLTKLDSWGAVGNRIVLLDSGLTDSVRQAFFPLKRKTDISQAGTRK